MSKKKSSVELQSLVVSSLIKDSSLLTMISNDLNVGFFTDPKYQFIYKLLLMYNQKYDKSPTQHEFLVMIDSYYNEIYGDKSEIIDLVNVSYATPTADKHFVQDAVEEFIRLSKFEEILLGMVDSYNTNGTFDVESVIAKIDNTYSYQVQQINPMDPGSYSQYMDAKKDAIGDSNNPTIIKSSVQDLNHSLTYGGYKYGDLGMIVAAPGTGKTTFLINEAVSTSIQGYNVLLIYFGDMTEYSASTRLMSNITQIDMNEFVKDPMMYNKQLLGNPVLKTMNPLARIRIISYPPGETSSNQIRTIVNNCQKECNMHFDMIVVDYADNLAEESDNIYKNGGIIYTKLKSLAQTRAAYDNHCF